MSIKSADTVTGNHCLLNLPKVVGESYLGGLGCHGLLYYRFCTIQYALASHVCSRLFMDDKSISARLQIEFVYEKTIVFCKNNLHQLVLVSPLSNLFE